MQVKIDYGKLGPGDVGPGQFHQGLGQGRYFRSGLEAGM